ncbi:glycoside hydrolase family 26 protein [Planctomonas psychrotolerans]|uniref:glycoside hydrolase family 26 protein n=1 Tax=Planctomonas psychrotolerans TaxID=2528712 RepID=UPI0029D410F6|nr:glycosyl hydrolase [Planctomonas psychrotolerans]
MSLLTWEPWKWGGGVDQPAFRSDRIAAGDYDAHISEWGTALAAWGKPVMLRYGHEMNGNWYPWADGVNDNTPGDYVAAYRHVHDLVEAAGATNVEWVWSPNIPDWGFPTIDGLYPGDGYVDIVALDGYNWGTTATWSTWTAPDALFGEGLRQLRALAPEKPILIAETASTDVGGSKVEWIRQLIDYLSAQPDVIGVVWFNQSKELDWRIESSGASTAAFRGALSGRLDD